jgi:16S rRNA C967 or C1407 C5-methylase (RsmB/RsmF family)
LRKGEEAFHQYYAKLFGSRWPALQALLERPSHHLELREGLIRSYYLDPASVAVASLLPLPPPLPVVPLPSPSALVVPPPLPLPPPSDTSPAEILDLCAAPGGKTLVLAVRLQRMYDRGAGNVGDAGLAVAPCRLVANEKSSSRRQRLLRVLDTHLPGPQRSRVSVYGHDASRWGVYRPSTAAAVLADVPCSTEGHVLQDPAELSRWSPTRIHRNAKLQHAILAAAIDTVVPGGYVLYSTCALTPEENDDVVSWALERRAGLVEVVPPEELPALSFQEDSSHEGSFHEDSFQEDGTGPLAPSGDTTPGWSDLRAAAASTLATAERTDRGLHILPDISAGAGPMYVALLRRKLVTDTGDSATLATR